MRYRTQQAYWAADDREWRAEKFGIPIRTLEKWEQGTRKPDKTAQSTKQLRLSQPATRFKVIAREPDVVSATLGRDKTVNKIERNSDHDVN
jgi:hypothetical protein